MPISGSLVKVWEPFVYTTLSISLQDTGSCSVLSFFCAYLMDSVCLTKISSSWGFFECTVYNGEVAGQNTSVWTWCWKPQCHPPSGRTHTHGYDCVSVYACVCDASSFLSSVCLPLQFLFLHSDTLHFFFSLLSSFLQIQTHTNTRPIADVTHVHVESYCGWTDESENLVLMTKTIMGRGTIMGHFWTNVLQQPCSTGWKQTLWTFLLNYGTIYTQYFSYCHLQVYPAYHPPDQHTWKLKSTKFWTYFFNTAVDHTNKKNQMLV